MYINYRIFLLFIALFSFQMVIYAESAMNTTKKNIKQFEELRQSLVNDYSKKNQSRVLKESKKIVLSLVDLKEISDLSLGRYLKTIKPSQLEKFRAIFSDIMSLRLIDVNVPNKKKLKKKNPLKIIKEYQYKDNIFKKDAVIVFCQIKRKKIIYDIELVYYKSLSGYLLYDVKIDDFSTLLDFKNQFNRIIRKRGIDYLIKVLNKKIKRINQKKK